MCEYLNGATRRASISKRYLSIAVAAPRRSTHQNRKTLQKDLDLCYHVLNFSIFRENKMCNICFCAFLQVYTHTHTVTYLCISKSIFSVVSRGFLSKQIEYVLCTHIILYICGWWLWIKKLMHRRMILYICVCVCSSISYLFRRYGSLYRTNITLCVSSFVYMANIHFCLRCCVLLWRVTCESFFLNELHFGLRCICVLYIFSCRSFWYDTTRMTFDEYL